MVGWLLDGTVGYWLVVDVSSSQTRRVPPDDGRDPWTVSVPDLRSRYGISLRGIGTVWTKQTITNTNKFNNTITATTNSYKFGHRTDRRRIGSDIRISLRLRSQLYAGYSCRYRIYGSDSSRAMICGWIGSWTAWWSDETLTTGPDHDSRIDSLQFTPDRRIYGIRTARAHPPDTSRRIRVSRISVPVSRSDLDNKSINSAYSKSIRLQIPNKFYSNKYSKSIHQQLTSSSQYETSPDASPNKYSTVSYSTARQLSTTVRSRSDESKTAYGIQIKFSNK